MQGILLVNKPIDWTSFDVVAYIRRIIASEQKVKPAQVKVGHTGTLDPLATGLLVLLIGKKYTKLAADFSKLDKEYLVEVKLGETTTSGDQEMPIEFYSAIKPAKSQVEQALESFRGKIMQKPPIYSAIKVNGQRAYKMARQGQKVELAARDVNIYSLDIISYDYPLLSLRTKVSSGTYIRSLVTDLGDKLGSGAFMLGLNRTEVGNFKLSESLSLEKLSYQQISEHLIFV